MHDRSCAARALLAVVAVLLADVAVALSPMPLIGTVWAWHATTAPGGARTEIPAPDRYTIELTSDGTVRVRADCNRGSGRYRHDDVDLRFGPIATTKKGCPADSLDREFLERLAAVERFRFEGIDLVLTTARNAGDLHFRPLAR